MFIGPPAVLAVRPPPLVAMVRPPVPVVRASDVAPVLLPIVMVFAAASVPRLSAPVPVWRVTALLSVVPRIDATPGALPPSCHEVLVVPSIDPFQKRLLPRE